MTSYKGYAHLDGTSGKVPAAELQIADSEFEICPFSDLGSSGTYYCGGFYDAPASSATLTIGGTVTQTYGTATYMKSARVFVVTAGASAGATVLTVTGVSISDAGVKNDADSEVLIADCSTCGASSFYQTTKKWLGQITLTLSGGVGTNALTFNYGFCREKSITSRNFTITSFIVQLQGGASESGFDTQLMHHKATGWTYSAAAFVPGTGYIVSSANDLGTNVTWANGVYASYKRTGLTTAIAGATGGEGFIVKVKTSNNNTIKYGYARIGFTLTS